MSIFRNWTEGSVLITDAGWGDSGKGKVVSALRSEIGAKVIGGHNAGHTVVTDKGELGLGLVPSAVIYPKTLSVIGQEVVINPLFLINEIKSIKKFGINLTPKNLMVDPRSHIIMPWHEIRDTLSEEARGKAAVGSLHLGVGWAYSDRINRRGLRLIDIYQSDWKEKIRKELTSQLAVIEDMRKDVKRKTGKVSKLTFHLSEKEMLTIAKTTRSILKPFSANTIDIIWKAIDKNAKILFEDSHGAMLDVAHGSWPFTTGVNTGLGGVYRSFGGKAVKSIVKTVVCSKAYQTRVGGGPMPTEDFGSFGEAVRQAGHEFGTRSGRPRRCGAFDIPILNYGYDVLGLTKNDEIALTKLDVFTGLKQIPVCTSYNHKGKTYKASPNADAAFLENVKPKIINLRGWSDTISNAKSIKELPNPAKKFISFLQAHIKPKITFVGVGKHKDAYVLTS
jgi:adenylosuccinate synthase